MEFKNFLVKHGVLQEFCNEVRRQINKLAGSQCCSPSPSDTACIMGLHWRYTVKGRDFWIDLYDRESREVTDHKYEMHHYYKFDEKIPKCLKRL